MAIRAASAALATATLVMFQGLMAAALIAADQPGATLLSGQVLHAGQHLSSGAGSLLMAADGNLVSAGAV